MTKDSDRAPSRAVDRALTILEQLATTDKPMTLTILARTTGVPMATASSIVHTLEQRGYAARQVVGRSHFWRATLKVNSLAVAVMRKTDIAEIAQPHLQRLVEHDAFAAHVGELRGRDVVYVAKVAGPGMVQFNTYQGKTSPFHVTALGRAIAAYLPAEQLAPMLRGLAPGTGPNATPTDPGTLKSMLDKVREQGYAVEDEEEDRGIGCLAAPLFGPDGKVIASIGVAGFVDRFRGRRGAAVRNLVCEQASLLTNALVAGSPGDAPA